MKNASLALVGAFVAMAAGTASAQSAPVPAASAPAPMTAASRTMPTRNPALTAAENTREPGLQRPDQRAVPQVSVALRGRLGTEATAASAPAGSLPGAVNDGAARCLAAGSASDRAACERALAASAPKAER